MTLLWRASLAAVWPVQAVLLVIVAGPNRDRINPDAVSYLRIAQYYLHGQTDVMISGYWGPMLSWLIVPWLLVFEDPLLAARAAMAVSAVVFLCGGFCVLRAVRLPGAAIMLGTWILALLGVAWSVAVITPDLLMAGLLGCGTSWLLSDKWVAHAGTAFGAGLVLGASYLAKAVALPVAVLMIIGVAGTTVAISQCRLRQVVRATGMTCAGLLLVAGPWIGVLSQKYGRPVFATSGPINHALVGPLDLARDYRGRIFDKPETGRITSMEDPAIPAYPYQFWSPLENVSSAVHQVRVIGRNAVLIVRYLKAFDWLGLGLVSAIFGSLLGRPWRQSLREERWRWSLIPVAALTGIYLPVFAEADRYYVAALPFLLGASFGFALSVSGALGKQQAGKRTLALAVVTLSFVIGSVPFFYKTFHPSASANPEYLAAKLLAEKLTATGLVGPIASVGPGHRIGLYLAYLLNVPWFGQPEDVLMLSGMEAVNDPEEMLSSGAALIVSPRGTLIAEQLREDPRFTSADKQLFGCDAGMGGVPFEVYLTRSRTANDTCPESGPGHL